jgi:hypothetical protein
MYRFVESCESELKVAEGELALSNSPFGTLRPSDVRKSSLYTSSVAYRTSCDSYIKLLSTVSSLKSTLGVLRRAQDRRKYNLLLYTESDEVLLCKMVLFRRQPWIL